MLKVVPVNAAKQLYPNTGEAVTVSSHKHLHISIEEGSIEVTKVQR